MRMCSSVPSIHTVCLGGGQEEEEGEEEGISRPDKSSHEGGRELMNQLVMITGHIK